jgi:hypothetical protein
MRRKPHVSNVLGSLAVAGMLALLSPGIEIVRADDGPVAAEAVSSSDGLACEAGTIDGAEEVAEYLRRIQQLQIEEGNQDAPNGGAGDEAIVLNNRGYNYGPANLNLPHPRELESQR